MKQFLRILFFACLTTLLGYNAFAQVPVITYPAIAPSNTIQYTDGTTITPLTPTVTNGTSSQLTQPVGFVSVPNPRGVATDASGNIYVTDKDDALLYKYSSAGVGGIFSLKSSTLGAPSGVAVDASGNICIADSDANSGSRLATVYIYNAAGTTQLIKTSGKTFINNPHGVAVDANNNFYVVNSGLNDIVKFTVSGSTYTPAAIIAGLKHPYGIAIAGNNLYVSQDSTYNNVIEYIGGAASTPVYTNTVTITLPSGTVPTFLSADASGNIYVADATNNRLEYIASGTTARSATLLFPGFSGLNEPYQATPFGSGSSLVMYETDYNSNFLNRSTVAPFSISKPLPNGLSFDPNTGIISGTPTNAAATANYTITAYNSSGSGNITITIGVSSAKPSISYTPQSENLHVGLAMTALTPVNIGGTVHPVSFTTPGTVIVPHTASSPHGLGVDASGNIYVANEATGGAVNEYSPTGAGLGQLGSGFANPISVCFDSSGNAYVLDENVSVSYGGSVYKITPGGVQTQIITGLAAPYGIAIDGAGYLYIANNSNTDVQKYANTGGPILLDIVGTKPNALVGPVSVCVDDSFNIYIEDYNKKAVYEYNSAGLYITTFISGLKFPLGMTIDDANNIYITDSGTHALTVYSPSGTAFFTYSNSTSLPDPEGIAIDAQNNLYVTDNTNFTVTKFVPSSGYFVNPVLPTGLSFNGNTGVFSGTPTVSFPKTNYTVSAVNTAGTGTFVVSLACFQYFDWLGNNNNWGSTVNWNPATIPISSDSVKMGVNVAFNNIPSITTTNYSVNSITFGTAAGGTVAPGISVASTGSFSIGSITYQSDSKSSTTMPATIAGSGAITVGSVSVIGNTHIAGSSYTEAINSSASNLTITNNVSLTSSNTGSDVSNAAFNVTGGTTKIGGIIQTTNTAGSTSTLNVAAVSPSTTATLQLVNATPLSGLSSTGTNVVKFNGAGATVEYAGAAQTVYTDASIPGLSGGVGYQNIKFSGTGIKTAGTGNLNIAGNFTNTLANDAADYVNFTTPTVNFNGTNQSIAAGSANGSTFYNVNMSGAGTKTLLTGNLNIASTGVLTLTGSSSTVLAVTATNSVFTLNSDVNGTATIAALNGPAITGTVNVQRFITGGAGFRGYRLLSSPVYAATVGSNKVYSLNYLQNSSFITGAAGGGFDKTGNPTLYLFREDITPNNTSFISGNYWGISAINNTPNYNYYLNNGSTNYNIPVGDGYLFFFRGDRNATGQTVATETATNYVPTNTTITASGNLVQGPVTFADWYTPTAQKLGYTGTGTGTNASVRGFNLVGNPYPSSIDWDKLDSVGGTGIATSHVQKYIYVLDVNGSYNVYAAGNGGLGGTIATSGSNIIPSGQGFFVIAESTSNPSGATLTFNESAKTNAQATAAKGNLFLGAPPQAAVRQYINIRMVKDSVNYDGTLVEFDSNAHLGYNGSEDALYKAGSGQESISSISPDNIALAINTQALPKLTPTVVPLNVNATSDGIYHLNMAAIQSLPSIYEVWLMDAYKKDSLDCRNNPTYAFNIYKSDTTSFGSKRFSLVIRQNPALSLHLLNFTANKTSGGSQVTWKTENEQNYTNFTVERSVDNGTTFNVLGGFASANMGTYSFLDKTPAPAANQYRLKLVDLNGTISYSNIVTLMYANAIAGSNISVYPNPASNTIHLAINATSNLSNGQTIVLNPGAGHTPATTYSIKIVSVTGSVIKTATSTSPNWDDNVGSLLPGTYFIQVMNNHDNTEVGKSTFVKL